MTVTGSSSRGITAASSTAGPSLRPQQSQQLKHPSVEQELVQAWQEQHQQEQQEQQVMINWRGRDTLVLVLRDNGDGTFLVRCPNGDEESVESIEQMLS